VLVPFCCVEENVEALENINNAAAAAEHGLPVTLYVPGKTDARREIVRIGVIGLADLLPNLHDTLRPIEVR